MYGIVLILHRTEKQATAYARGLETRTEELDFAGIFHLKISDFVDDTQNIVRTKNLSVM